MALPVCRCSSQRGRSGAGAPSACGHRGNIVCENRFCISLLPLVIFEVDPVFRQTRSETETMPAAKRTTTSKGTKRASAAAANTASLVIKGARVHNLKNVSLELPHNKLIVITGVSGSGKSSLAFDTIYAEGQRRYVESLSAYARQFLERMDKPDVDFIRASLRPSPSNRRPRAGTPDPPSAQRRRSTTTCACCSPASGKPGVCTTDSRYSAIQCVPRWNASPHWPTEARCT